MLTQREIDKEQLMAIINSGIAPLSCTTCIFRSTRMHTGDEIVAYVQRPYCRIMEQYLDTGFGREICEVEDFVRKMVELI